MKHLSLKRPETIGAPTPGCKNGRHAALRLCAQHLVLLFLMLSYNHVKAQQNLSPALGCGEESTPVGNGLSLCQTFDPFVEYIEVGEGLATMSDVLLALNMPTADFTGVAFLVSSDFFIDVRTVLNDCVVKVDNGAGIYLVDGNSTLDCTNTVFFSCTQMWKGIGLLAEAGNVTISLAGCRIEDADAALDLSEAATPTLAISSTIFNKNYIGVYCQPPLGHPRSTLDISAMVDVSFTCDAPLRPGAAHLNINKQTGSTSWAGMELHRASVTIGLNGGGSAALFDGLRAGIRANEVSLNINGGCQFKNMTGLINKNAVLTAGWGIIVYNNSTLRIGNSPCTFSFNLQGGIFSERSYINVHDCIFRYGGYGVFSEENTGISGVNLQRNKIIMGNKSIGGIFVDRPVAKWPIITSIYIAYNEIERVASVNVLIDPLAPPQYTAAIAISMARSGHSTSGLLRPGYLINNKYTDHTSVNNGFLAGDIGFRLWNAVPPLSGVGAHLKISGNTLEYTATNATDKTGLNIINLIGSKGTNVTDNQITVANGGINTTGLRQLNSQRLTLCNNNINNFDTGMFFSDNNIPTDLAENHFENNGSFGLLVLNGGIGPQTRTLNTWSQPQPAGATAAGISPSFVSTSPYVTADASPSTHPTNVNPSNWFTIQDGPLDGCKFFLEPPIAPGDGLDEADLMLLNGALIRTNLTDYQKWAYGLNLMRKLLGNHSIALQNPGAMAYYNQYLQQPLGKFAQFYRLLEDPTVEPVAILEQISLKNSLLDSYIAQIDNINTMLQQSGLSPSAILDLRQKKAMLQTNYNQIFGEILVLSQQLEQLHVVQYQNAAALNNTIVPGTIFEANLKTFNDIWLRKLINGNLSSADIGNLQVIASQDPEIGGDAVTAAQNLLPVDCNPGSALRPAVVTTFYQSPNNPKAHAVSVFPNPTTGLVYWTGTPNTPVTVKVFNLTGQLVESANTTDNQIDLNRLENGLYLMQIQASDGSRLASQKLLIQH